MELSAEDFDELTNPGDQVESCCAEDFDDEGPSGDFGTYDQGCSAEDFDEAEEFGDELDGRTKEKLEEERRSNFLDGFFTGTVKSSNPVRQGRGIKRIRPDAAEN